MTRGFLVAAMGLVLAMVAMPDPARADPPCGKGWRKHEWCGGRGHGPRHGPPPVYYAPPPVVYAPPPVYYAPPPPVYYAPPVYVPTPGLSIGVTIPLR